MSKRRRGPCVHCKKLRTLAGYGLCPACYPKHRDEYADRPIERRFPGRKPVIEPRVKLYADAVEQGLPIPYRR